MRALYTITHDSLYKVNQEVRIPRNVINYMGNNLTMTENRERKSVSINIWLNAFDKKHAITNEDLIEITKENIMRNQITQIDNVSNFYKMAIDYTLMDRYYKELEHSVSVYPLKPIDSIIPIGITENNHLPFRFVKSFSKIIDFRFRDGIPFGIMKDKSDTYYFKINDIRVFQDTNIHDEKHQSLEERPMSYDSHSVVSYLEHTVLVFSSREKGINFDMCYLTFIPRVMSLNLELMLDNFIVAYDSNIFDRLITENIANKNEPADWGKVCPHKPVHPKHHDNHWCHKNGIFVISEPVHHDSLLVVEDLYPAGEFDPDTMVRKYQVISDCPSIEVGDYVRFIPDDCLTHRPAMDDLYDDEPNGSCCDGDACDINFGPERIVPPWLKE